MNNGGQTRTAENTSESRKLNGYLRLVFGRYELAGMSAMVGVLYKYVTWLLAPPGELRGKDRYIVFPQGIFMMDATVQFILWAVLFEYRTCTGDYMCGIWGIKRMERPRHRAARRPEAVASRKTPRPTCQSCDRGGGQGMHG